MTQSLSSITGNKEEDLSTNGAKHSRPLPGPQTQGRNRDLEGVTTRQKVEWSADSNITELTIFCTIPEKTSTITVNTTGADNAEMLASTDVSNYSTVLIQCLDSTTATGIDFSWSNDNISWFDGEDAVLDGAMASVSVAAKYMKILQNGAGSAAATASVIVHDDLPLYGMVAIDAGSDAIADALLSKINSIVDDNGYFPIPLNEVVTIPLTDAITGGSLGGGRVDIKSSNAGTALDFWIGAN